MLMALDLLLNGVKEVVIATPTGRTGRDYIAEAFRTFIPDKVVLAATRETYGELSKLSTLLEGRRPEGKGRAFVCQNFVCKLPAESIEELRDQLGQR
jgi:hypothetical protein